MLPRQIPQPPSQAHSPLPYRSSSLRRFLYLYEPYPHFERAAAGASQKFPSDFSSSFSCPELVTAETMAESLRLLRRYTWHAVRLERPDSSRAPCYGVRRPVLEDFPASTAARPKELECSSTRARGTRQSITTFAAWSAACAGRSTSTATSSSDPLRVGRCRYFGISWSTRRCRFASPVVAASSRAPVKRTRRRATLCSKMRSLNGHQRCRFTESETADA